ncbi:hypothetical protein FIN92_06010 [Prevotella brunnea]|uniref:hypothetical protein n=1 Tax=Prevotella brunnea TaxID=2508867 RepID=UPI0028170C98|nr:hypothetical protein [Prevotella brunnea]MDR0186134.1 hypothetical protein [Prevotella brunnea]
MNRWESIPTQGENLVFVRTRKAKCNKRAVLANKGLFLPITGFRSARDTQVVYRYVDNVSIFYSAYLTSQETAASTINAFFFGSNEWNPTGTPQKQQGNPIRPVWDSGNETAPIDASKFAPFNKIVTTFGARKY